MSGAKGCVVHRLRGKRVEICYALSQIGEDLLLEIRGGQAHIGCVVLAAPRESLRKNGVRSATSSVLNLPTHKDEAVLRSLAERLCAISGRTVCALGGVHMEPFGEAALKEVEAVNAQALEAAAEWLEELT